MIKWALVCIVVVDSDFLVQDEEIIARRTRSKHPLVDTSLSAIEGNESESIQCNIDTFYNYVISLLLSAASFIPPDAEDPPTPMELDPEDLEWQSWLNDLLNPSG